MEILAFLVLNILALENLFLYIDLDIELISDEVRIGTVRTKLYQQY